MALAGLALPFACSNNNNPTTPAETPSPTPVPTNWAGYTSTPTIITFTPTNTVSSTPTNTFTLVPGANTYTPTGTPTITWTPTQTLSPTVTLSPTLTPTNANGYTSTMTFTITNTFTVTNSFTPTNTPSTPTPILTSTPTNTFVATPPTLTGTPWTTGSFSPNGLAADASGTTYVYVAEEKSVPSNSGQVEVFNSAGVSQGLLTGVSFGEPYGTAVDPSGNIYVVDRINNAVYIFNSSNVYQSTLSSWATSTSGPTAFSAPEGIAVDGANLYVADTGHDEIEIFALASLSSSVTEWGGTGSGNGTFNNPSAIAVDGSGNVYVADASNQLIQEFSASTFLFNIQFSTVAGSDIFGIAVNGSNIYAADVANSQVEIYSLTGNLLAAGPGTNAPNSPSPDGVIVFGSNILVSDFNNNAIYNFQP